MTRILAIFFGILFIFVGVAGFLPTFKSEGLLFGYFTANSINSIIHVVLGVISIMSATSVQYARRFFQVLGMVLITVAVWGFWSDGDLYIMQVKLPDSILHTVIGVIALLIGFSQQKDR